MTSSASSDFTGRLADKPLRACHCTQCRRWSGHVHADAATDNLTIQGQDSLRWHRSLDQAERGFCAVCGPPLHDIADDLPQGPQQ